MPHPTRHRRSDAEESGLKIVVHLLAIALIGVGMTSACLAEEAARDRGGSTLPANPDGTRPPAREDAPGGSKDADAIDTRITVHSERPGGRDAAKEGDRKVSPFARPIFRPRRLSKREGSGLVTRDAIGLPVIGHDGMERESGQRHDVPVIVHEPAVAPTGLGTNASGVGARTGSSVGRPSSNTNLIVRPGVLNRGTINGTTFARPGVGSSSVGGPAKPVAGISGTTIRPKH